MCAASSSLSRLSLFDSGSQMALALSTPHRVATNAPAMSSPSLSGLLRLPSTWIRPITVPMMPRVGAYPPMSPKNLMPTLSAAFFEAISASRMSAISSASVPSTVSSMPLRSNGSSTSRTMSSRASRPSRRARSAIATMTATMSWPSGTLPSTAFFSAAKTVPRSRMRPPAMAAPKVPTKTSSRAGSMSSAPGLPPSRIIESRTAPKIAPIPPRVPSSMSALQVLDGAQVARTWVLGGEPAGDGQDGRAEVTDLVDDLLDRLGHDVLGAGDQRDDGVGGRLDALDEVRVQREGAPVAPGHHDHGRVHPWQWLSAGSIRDPAPPYRHLPAGTEPTRRYAGRGYAGHPAYPRRVWRVPGSRARSPGNPAAASALHVDEVLQDLVGGG